MRRVAFLFWAMAAVLMSCSSSSIPDELYSSNGQIQAVVEIPAGSLNDAYWDEEQGEFVSTGDLDFLPYPGNFGFIPGTEHPLKEGGNGEALDVLVLSERMEQGSSLEIQPIALLKLKRNKYFENKVIAVPLNPDENPLDVKNYYEFQRDHYLCKNILMEWFLHVYRSDTVIFIGWENDEIARKEIERRKTF